MNYLERDGTTAKANTLAGTGSGIAFSNSVPEQTVRGSDTSPTSASHDMSLETNIKVAPSPSFLTWRGFLELSHVFF